MAVNVDQLAPNYAQKWNWRIEMQGYEKARFTTADRPKASFEVMEFNPGGTHRPIKQPGRVSFDDLTLERGEVIESETDFLDWMQKCLHFIEGVATVDRAQIYRTVDMVEYDNSDVEINRWSLHDAFISGYDGNDLDGSSSDTKTESITITYSYFTRTKR